MRIHFSLQNKNQNFEGIYKIRISPKNVKTDNFINSLSSNDYVLRVSNPFKEGNKKYVYLITRDNNTAEAFIEDTMQKNNLQYLKSLPIFKVLNKNMLDEIFKDSKNIQDKKVLTI